MPEMLNDLGMIEWASGGFVFCGFRLILGVSNTSRPFLNKTVALCLIGYGCDEITQVYNFIKETDCNIIVVDFQ